MSEPKLFFGPFAPPATPIPPGVNVSAAAACMSVGLPIPPTLTRRATAASSSLGTVFGNGLAATIVDAARQIPLDEHSAVGRTPAGDIQRQQRRYAFFNCLMIHAQAFTAFHRARRATLKSLAEATSKHAKRAEKEKEKEEEREERARLRALKQNDMAAYAALVQTTKNKRLQHLLQQTDSYLANLASLIEQQQSENARLDKEGIARMSALADAEDAKTKRKEERDKQRREAKEAKAKAAAAAASASDATAGGADLTQTEEADGATGGARAPAAEGDVTMTDTTTGGSRTDSPSTSAEAATAPAAPAPGATAGEPAPGAQPARPKPARRSVSFARDVSNSDSDAGSDDEDSDDASSTSDDEDDDLRLSREASAGATGGDGKSATASGTSAADTGIMATYYLTAHKTRERVTSQPSMLKGGSLKPYQLEGVEWMVSLYNNNLNGILADVSTVVYRTTSTPHCGMDGHAYVQNITCQCRGKQCIVILHAVTVDGLSVPQ